MHFHHKDQEQEDWVIQPAAPSMIQDHRESSRRPQTLDAGRGQIPQYDPSTFSPYEASLRNARSGVIPVKKDVLCGPLLDYRYMEGDRWMGSVLIVPEETASDYTPQIDPFIHVPGTLLYSDMSKSFWRFDIELRMGDTDCYWEYTVANVYFLHRERGLTHSIGGGNQIYNAGIYTSGPLKEWTEMPDHKDKLKHQCNEKLRFECDTWYSENYTRWYNTEPFASALCQIPSLNIWDDHDIIDGYGSYAKATMECSGWLPHTLRRPYLITLSTVLLLIAIAVEILRQYSTRHNGIVQYKQREDLSSSKWRAWADTPTIVGLVAVVLWEVFAHDLLRLEPYFQLADPKGAPASALFTNYSFDPGILAVIRAARNRHWIVLCVSLMSLAIHLLVASLLSGLFVLTSFDVMETTTLDSWPHLVGLETQDNWFALEAAHETCSQSSRGNDPALDNTVAYAVAPVSLQPDYNADFFTLSMNLSVYWSDTTTTCVNATVIGAVPDTVNLSTAGDSMNDHGLVWNFSNVTLPGMSTATPCEISIALNTSAPLGDGRFQARYWEPVQSDLAAVSRPAFNVTGCPSTGLLGMIIDMDSTVRTPLSSNVTFFACQSLYKQAIADVSYTGTSYPTTVQPILSSITDLSETDFSVQGFQSLMFSEHTRTSDSWNESISVVGDTEALNPTQYLEAIGRTWNSGFKNASDRLFDQQAEAVRIDAILSTYSVAIAVVPRVAALVEAIMFSSFALVLALSFIYPRRLNLLDRDPSSIAAQCNWIARLIDPDTLCVLSQPTYHVARTRQLRKWAKGLWCRWTVGSDSRRLELSLMDGSPAKMGPPPAASKRGDPMPHFLTLPWFVTECVLLMGAVTATGLTYSWIRVRVLDTMNSTEFMFAAAFLVYGPTMLASVVRSLINSLHRHLSVAESWIRLRQGMMPSRALSAPAYGPLKTLFVLRRSGPRPSLSTFGLSLVCVLNLILVVVTGGLFEPQINSYLASSSLTTSYIESSFVGQALPPDFHSFDRSVYLLSMNHSRLPWTTKDLSFQPFVMDMDESAVGVVFNAAIRGIGTSLSCEEVPLNYETIDDDTRTVNWTYPLLSDTQTTQCNVQLPLVANDTTRPAIQYTWPNNSDCQRGGFFVSATSLPNDNHTTTALHCTSQLHTQFFEVQVDPSGHILQHSAVPHTVPLTTGFFYANLTAALGLFNQNLGSFVHNISTQPLPYYLSSFPNHQTTQLYQTTQQTDATNTTQALISAVQTLYQSTFATYLTVNRDLIFPRGPMVEIPGVATYTFWGFMPSSTTIVIIIVILSIDVVALVAVFACYFGRYNAPRIPKAIGSLIPWVGGPEGVKRLADMAENGDEDRRYHFWSQMDADGQVVWVLGEVDREAEAGLEGDAVELASVGRRDSGDSRLRSDSSGV
ncbi:hypothetical protein BO86DRAFT_405752 [Aspergillus japonicus CBS 114.51]|uniref:PhoD-like phosphatase domain-containing protein n=1 Tax=Aspergillus japonicus CBS 114.51 TaxID=1448312 RepID=A0A8T8XFC7_ASPJA|nr:hypothetical protein BO86DRAFT_405752 [Aspergillus japonicus CBS 114.51]RAH86790.1 hypothetical protein BO86DRAFT_405752 [Aspergillus japonicus CBS 114.51]